MKFETISFITIFLPIALILYYAAVRNIKVQNGILVVSSLFFYCLGTSNILSIFILLASIIWNWLGGIMIQRRRENKKTSKYLLILVVGMNVAFFCFFRIMEMSLIQGFNLATSFIFPLGLAWFTLQGIGYCTDVYSGQVDADKNLVRFTLFISFFPKLIHGPLIDFSNMKEQLITRTYHLSQFKEGMQRFIIGLSKKLLVADQLTYFINYAFVQSAIDSTVVQPPITLTWLVFFVNGIQLYFQLSSYADMAIGLALMFGIRLPENFNQPFVATSLTDFWKRWNMTVIRWFRKYFVNMINVGKNHDNIIVQLFFTWLIFGLWLGFGWNFVLWGAFNFIILLVEHFGRYCSFYEKIRSIRFKQVYTLLIVLLGFVFLRSESLYYIGYFLRDLFGFNNNAFYDAQVLVFLKELWLPLVVGIYVMFIHPIIQEKRTEKSEKYQTWLALGRNVGIIILYVLCLLFVFLGFDLGQVVLA